MARRRWVRESDHKPMFADLLRRYREHQDADLQEAILAPSMVVFDMQVGNLERLDAYLGLHKGIPHPEIAAELRKLISGPFGMDCKFRLIAIEHPDAPPPKTGPASRDNTEQPTAEQIALVAAFEKQLPIERGKKQLAEKAVAKAHSVGVSRVQRARRAMRKHAEARKLRGEEFMNAIEMFSKLRMEKD